MSPDDAAGVADALLALAADRERREAMGARGRERTLELFTPSAAAARLQAQLMVRRPVSQRAPASGAATHAFERRGGQES